MNLRIVPLTIILAALISCQPKPDLSKYSQSDVVILKLNKTFTLHPDGVFEQQIEKKIKIQHPAAYDNDDWQTTIQYNTDYDSVAIELATIEEAGKKLVVINSFPDQVSAGYGKTAAFSSILQQKIFTDKVPDQTILTCRYSIFSKPGSRPALMGWEHFSPEYPVIDETIEVKVPKTQKLYYVSHNMEIDARVRRKGSYRLYRWKMGLVKPEIKEANGIRFNRKQAQLIFSSADSLFPVFNQFTSQRAFTLETNMEMRERIRKAIIGKNIDFEKFAALQNLIRQEIKTIDIPYRLMGYKIRSAIETWQSNEGTVAEQAVLLSAMIRSLNWKATPVAAVPAYLFKKDSSLYLPGNIDLLPIELVKFPTEGKIFYISPNLPIVCDATNDYPDHYLVPFEMGYSKVNLTYNKKKEVKFSWDGELTVFSSGIIQGTLDANFIDATNPYLGLKMNKGLAQKLYPAAGASIELARPEASLIRYNIYKTIEKGDDGLLKLKLPYGLGGIESWDIDMSIPTRKTMLELPGKLRELHRIVIKFPADYKPVGALVDMKKENELGSITIRHTVESGKIEVMRNITLKKSLIGRYEYPKLLALLTEWFNKDYREIRFSREN